VRRGLRLTAIWATVLFGLIVIASVVACGNGTSSPPERAEKQRKEVEQAAGDEQYAAAGDESAAGSGPTVRITRVVDGDTIEIAPEVDGKDTVRLIGIDAPEEATASCGAQPLAQDATYQMVNWKGSKAKLEFDEDRTDQYGRLLAYVHVPALEDIMLNEDMVLGSLAQVYIVPPNTEHEDRLREAQQEAKKTPVEFQPSIWTLSPAKQAQLADHGNGIGRGDGACPPKSQPQQNTATAPATATASPPATGTAPPHPHPTATTTHPIRA
jgi:endonuclease YncB( thermonuclease family)